MIDPAILERTFSALVSRACVGLRCPENGTFGVNGAAVPALARAGRIRIEISTRNFRRVVILEGPHAGKATAADPSGVKPWKILDKNGTRVRRRGGHAPRRNPPSLALPKLKFQEVEP